MRKSKKKLKNLILLIISEHGNSRLTETKLQKLLYFCDFNAFEESGNSITGFTYKRNNYGPTIMDLKTYLNELQEEGAIQIIEGKNPFGKLQHTFAPVNTEILDKTLFSDFELRIIEQVNNEYQELKPRDISAISHTDFPYVATKHLEDIDYDLVQYREQEEESCEENNIPDFSDDSFVSLVSKVSEKLSYDN
jgi:uncharacterized phage-associated protein